LQYVAKLIPQDHIRNLLESKILPTIFGSLFTTDKFKSDDKSSFEAGLSYDFVDLVTLQENKDDLHI